MGEGNSDLTICPWLKPLGKQSFLQWNLDTQQRENVGVVYRGLP